MTAHGGRRAPGTLESEVMSVLWTRGEPLTAAGVQEALGGDLAHNTVQTILIRLHDKALLQRRRAGRGHEYWPAQDAASAAADQMRAALGDRQDRLAVLQHFAASLDEADADALRELLAAAPSRPPRR
jgi:predicted transcriptional regulator